MTIFHRIFIRSGKLAKPVTRKGKNLHIIKINQHKKSLTKNY